MGIRHGIFALLGMAAASLALAATQIPEEVTKVRDPFKRPMSRLSHEKPRSPLELYPVDKFKLVGVVTGPKKLRAMLNGPDGKSYFVAEGTPIGVRKGVIRKITHDTIHVRERVLNVLGQEENVDSELKLPTEGKDLGIINAPMPVERERTARGGGNSGGGNQGGGNFGGGGNQNFGNPGPNVVNPVSPGGNSGPSGNQNQNQNQNFGNPGGSPGGDLGGGNNGGGNPMGSGGGNRQGGSG